MRRLAAVVLAAGCAELDDPSTVKDLRILAVQVDPSEVILDPERPEEIPELTVAPLLADPAGGGRPVTWGLVACPNDPLAAPPPPPGDYSGNYPAGGARSTVGSRRCPEDPRLRLRLGDGLLEPRTAIRFTRAQLELAFAADRYVDARGGVHGGLDLGMPITLEVSAQAGPESAGAIKRVLFWLRRIGDGHRPNAIPVIPEVRARDQGGAFEPVGMEPRPVRAGQALWVAPSPAEAEPYVTTIVDRLSGQVRPHAVARETLRYTFYATAGKFTPLETTSELPAGFVARGAEDPLASKYTPPETSQVVTIWIVVRDERGGLSWIERRLRVE